MAKMIDRYRTEYGNVEGWFSDESAVICDVILDHQADQGITGDIAEIGVAYGKSAMLFGLHLSRGETMTLNDIDPQDRLPEVAERVTRANAEAAVRVLKRDSRELTSADLGTNVRFFHIDGDHGRRAVLNDMRRAVDALRRGGVIVVDDFIAPQFLGVSFGVFKFLAENEIDVALFLAGFNKGYICLRSDLPFYLKMVRDDLPKQMHARDMTNFTIWKMQHAEDYNTFGIAGRQWDRDFVSITSDVSKPVHEDVTLIDIGDGPVEVRNV